MIGCDAMMMGGRTVIPDGTTNTSTTPATPAMTSDTTPSGVCDASNLSAGTVWALFNQDYFNDDPTTPGGGGLSYHSQTFPSWLRYQFAAPKVINKLGIMPRGSGLLSRAPQQFELRASANGINYDTLLGVGGTTYANNTINWWGFTNNKEYTWYQLYVFASGDMAYVNFMELILVEAQYL